jgi:hypothetical protein
VNCFEKEIDMGGDANKQTNNDFALEIADAIAISRTWRGAGIGAGITMLMGLFAMAAINSNADLLPAEAKFALFGGCVGGAFGLANGMRKKSESLENLLKNSTPKKTAGSGPIPPAI